ncbi:alanine racemase domain protein [Beutenbergia cavernae DSM 12333]|uniref:Alanine racemase domain protein n=1 Tax=Beutenbergia cavernae (strain ATCC BAA-8 / DSM 12333 / CCUG 43141 / JCM 11478 / NBRC 16432 / NCIMB 13614 / HKI 0122) TaxID=471853 RepID=C5C5G3_BEUC1|nr:alanine racemase [Beutenbergia cavernae]ACQ80154.1 alanine racemase domain protein [Beutenbergia cavernae DSM 12333]
MSRRDAGVPREVRAAVAHLDPPFGVVDLGAFRANAGDLVRRARGVPIRVATKSVRIRELLAATLERPGFAGVLAYTLPEALWLVEQGFDDVVVGYPTAHRAALGALAADERAARSVTLMVDDVAQLDLVDAVTPPGRRPEIRICLELDAAFRTAGGAVRFGAWRSPVGTPDAAVRLARAVVARPGFALVGLMAYEGQIAGVGDAGRGPRAIAVRAMQRASAAELAERRAAVVAAVRRVADLEFVNGGGTGSLETTTSEAAVTEVTAGSGLLGSGLFDTYRAFRPRPASWFVLPVVRRPTRGVVTVLGGGWVASGPPGHDRLPSVAHPPGLAYVAREAAGEVQTPLRGRAARRLAVGDHVWFRHAKAGEGAEHLGAVVAVDSASRTADGAAAVVGELATYRGEGQAFL